MAGSAKRLVGLEVLDTYQLKTGHCLTRQHLNWTKSMATVQCWWCPHRTQTREHIFKNCPEWKAQQGFLWVEVQKEVGWGFKIRGLADAGAASWSWASFPPQT